MDKTNYCANCGIVISRRQDEKLVRIAELDERLRVQDQWRRELEQRVKELEKAHRAIVDEYHHRGNTWATMAAAAMADISLKALEGGKQDGTNTGR